MIETRIFRGCLAVLVTMALNACEDDEAGIVGQLQSDRVELAAEAGERLLARQVSEGERVEGGAVLLVQDTRRIDLQVQELLAGIRVTEARLAEQLAGPRMETIDAARVRLEDARAETRYREAELQRLRELRELNLTSAESMDQAARQHDAAGAAAAVVAVQLQELENGTRPEQIEQTRRELELAQAQMQRLELERGRLTITAPVSGLVDSLPFETGEQPRAGEVVAILLTGTQPLARVHVPETRRLQLSIGDPVQVIVDGLTAPLAGTVRWIASEPAFTPYFALTESERGRLSYLAEISLPDQSERLPDGLPVEVLVGPAAGPVND